MAALRGYRGNSDWQVEEGLFAEMIVLGFPSSLLVMGGLMVAGFVFQRFGTNLSDLPNRALTGQNHAKRIILGTFPAIPGKWTEGSFSISL